MRAHIFLQRFEGVTNPRGIDAATLANLASATALPPHHLAEGLDQVARRQAIGFTPRYFDGKIATANNDRDAVAIGAVEGLIGEQKQVFLAFVDQLQHEPDPGDVGLFELGTTAGRQSLAKAPGLFLEALDLCLEGRDSRGKLGARGPKRVAQFAEDPFVITDPLLRRGTGSHLDAANARADAVVVRDQGQANFAAALDVRPPAEFTRPIAEGDDPDEIAVLLVEECDRPGGDRLLERKLLDSTHEDAADLFIEQPGDPIDLIRGQGPGKAEIEGCVIGLHGGTSLARLVAEDITECTV